MNDEDFKINENAAEALGLRKYFEPATYHALGVNKKEKFMGYSHPFSDVCWIPVRDMRFHDNYEWALKLYNSMTFELKATVNRRLDSDYGFCLNALPIHITTGCLEAMA
jgi:hypothetical protein